MTTTERLVLEVLCASLRQLGHPPTPEEIMRSAELPSLAAVHYFLDNLQRKKLIRRDPTQPRAIEVHCAALEAKPLLAQPQPAADEVPEEESAAVAEREIPEVAAVSVDRPAPAVRSQEAAGQRLEKLEEEVVEEVVEEEPTGRVFGRGEPQVSTDPTLVTVPLLGRVAAGSPIDTLPGEPRAIYRLPRALAGGGTGVLFMVRVTGDSMMGGGIHDRDMVVVRRQQEAENGQIVVARDEAGDAVVKRLWRSDEGRVELRSENPVFGQAEMTGGELLGVVVSVIRQL